MSVINKLHNTKKYTSNYSLSTDVTEIYKKVEGGMQTRTYPVMQKTEEMVPSNTEPNQ
jgi:hypothetical protein